MKYTFTASHVSCKENALFPDKIIIDDEKVTYYKGKLIGYNESVISLDRVGSVSVDQGLLFADITIESKGSQAITARGFTRSDAKQIIKLLS